MPRGGAPVSRAGPESSGQVQGAVPCPAPGAVLGGQRRVRETARAGDALEPAGGDCGHRCRAGHCVPAVGIKTLALDTQASELLSTLHTEAPKPESGDLGSPKERDPEPSGSDSESLGLSQGRSPRSPGQAARSSCPLQSRTRRAPRKIAKCSSHQGGRTQSPPAVPTWEL